jgi:hypothetical protein
MTAIAFETTGPLAVITMTHEPHNLLGPDLMEPLLDALQRASSQRAGGSTQERATALLRRRRPGIVPKPHQQCDFRRCGYAARV